MSETTRADDATKGPALDRDGTGRDGDDEPKKHRNGWIWVSAALGVVAVGLLIWGLNSRSDLDKSQDQVARLESESQQSKENGSAVLARLKSAFVTVTSELGATQQDLAATEQAVKSAEQVATQATQDAATAQKDAANAKNQAEKQKAETAQANAEAKAANSKVEIATDCATSYASALGSLFEGQDVRSQAAAVKQQLQSISSSCRTALGGG